ncbi:SDR family NAD(P)-dependent oxidoreductase [Candidatus Dojkabacteria bacterium]|uniref:SDR family NAD(P)-dependent oxidoreductase n=1 Tax=Candidatus Dojkabacteria bacterium TaxID=2099670 RepID=A0A955RGC6_9BACT|nr:SDR family NAD(P)-dependent oxidoreductase [Candidatus Dojkabacteria bacterium]
MNHKTIIVTGANSGKGMATVERLAALGHTVVMATYSQEKGVTAQRQILKKVPKADIPIMTVNLDNPVSINEFVKQFEVKFQNLEVLINNAGIFREEKIVNTIGIDKVFMVNVIAPIMLSLKFKNLLMKSKPARIINLGSIGEKYGTVDIDNLNGEKEYEGNIIYNQSKRALVSLSYKLAKEFADTGISVNTLHPGTLKSDRIDEPLEISWFDRLVEKLMKPITMQTDSGVDTTVYLAVSPDVEDITGRYFSGMSLSDSSKSSHDENLQNELWDYVMKIIKPYL